MKKLLISSLALALTAAPVSAGEPEYGFTNEFASACLTSTINFESSDDVFGDLQWESADSDTKDALKPDDVLKVKKHKAWKIELKDGSMWFAAFAQGKIGKKKYSYCALTIIVDELEGWKSDLERQSGLKMTAQDVSDVESRTAYLIDGIEGSVLVREISSEDTLMIEFGKLTPIMKKKR